jgi:hypothetical protein
MKRELFKEKQKVEILKKAISCFRRIENVLNVSYWKYERFIFYIKKSVAHVCREHENP